MPTRNLSLGPAGSDDGGGAQNVELPTCPLHPGSLVRRYRVHGPRGPGVYSQCVPNSGVPHRLGWSAPFSAARRPSACTELSPHENEVLIDAAEGLTFIESAASHSKSVETVKSQRKNIMLKLGAHNMAHAVGITG